MNTSVGGLQTQQVGAYKRVDVLGGDYTVHVASGSYSLTTSKSIEFKVGKASLTLDASGKVTIKGSEFLFDASGPVQINGKDVDLN